MNEWNRLHDCCHADQEVASVATSDTSTVFFHFTGINLYLEMILISVFIVLYHGLIFSCQMYLSFSFVRAESSGSASLCNV
jgi:accessory gene regulator protein AgrB